MKRAVLILALFVLLLSACDAISSITDKFTEDKPRDFSTPSSRLVGRWKSKAEKPTEKYFSPIDPKTGEGTYTEYSLEDGTVFVMTYMIISEAPAGEKLTILYWGPDGTEFPYADLVVPQDGLRVRFRDYFIEYIDNKTEYAMSDHGPIPTSAPITEYKYSGNSIGFFESKSDAVPLYIPDNNERLLPADGASTAYCDKQEDDKWYLLSWCYMYSPKLGVNGWVIRATIAEIH